MIEVHGRQIERALIVDDEQHARDAYEYVVEDMDLQPHQVTGPLDDLAGFIASIEPNDAVLSDFHLRKRTYASWDGTDWWLRASGLGFPVCCARPLPIRRFDETASGTSLGCSIQEHRSRRSCVERGRSVCLNLMVVSNPGDADGVRLYV